MASAKARLFCLGLNVLTNLPSSQDDGKITENVLRNIVLNENIGILVYFS